MHISRNLTEPYCTLDIGSAPSSAENTGIELSLYNLMCDLDVVGEVGHLGGLAGGLGLVPLGRLGGILIFGPYFSCILWAAESILA